MTKKRWFLILLLFTLGILATPHSLKNQPVFQQQQPLSSTEMNSINNSHDGHSPTRQTPST